MGAQSKDVADYSQLLEGAIWSLTILSTIFVALRVYAKIFWKRALLWDDWFLIASWACLLVSAALLTEGVKYGIGLHYEDMDPEKIPETSKFSYAAGFTTILGTSWSKTSFGITLLRISSGWLKWFVWFIIISVNLVLSASAILLWVQCLPVEKLFDELAEGTCFSRHIIEDYQTFCSAYSGVADIVLALLPWKIVWSNTIFRTEKIGALVAMSVGVISGLVSFMKIIFLDNISDVTSTTVDLKIFGIAELASTIIAVSIPVLRAFLRRQHSTTTRAEFVSLSELPSTGSSRYQEIRKGASSPKELTLTQSVDSYGRPGRSAYEV